MYKDNTNLPDGATLPKGVRARSVGSADTESETIQERAIELRDAGFSILPVKTDGSKSPAVAKWKDFMERRPTDSEIKKMFASGPGIAVVGGEISGNLEIIDIDDPDIVEEFQSLCRDEGLETVMDRVVMVATPSGGMHIMYRCDRPVGASQHLAQRLVPVSEGTRGAVKVDGQYAKIEIRIETRAEGSLAVTYPSPAACHPDGKPYRRVQGHLTSIPTITSLERAALLNCARVFNEYTKPQDVEPVPTSNARDRGHRPGDDYNSRGDVMGLLRTHGWTETGSHGQSTMLRRPGKSRPGSSATYNHGGSGLFYVFSSNASPFDALRAYSPFGVYTLLEHNGDYKAAAKALANEGYGEPKCASKAVDALSRADKGHSDRLTEPCESDDLRPFVDVGGQDLASLTISVWAAVEAANVPPFIYRNGGGCKRLEKGEQGSPILADLTLTKMRHEISRLIRPYKLVIRGRDADPIYEPSLCPRHLIEDMLATDDPPVPFLDRIVLAPVFSKDGVLQTEPGYNSDTRTYYHARNGQVIPSVPDRPTKQDIDRAVSLFRDDLLVDFPFFNHADVANAVALGLLPYVRDMISGPTPLHVIEANIEGSGKGLLRDVLLEPSFGSSVGICTDWGTDSELRKRVTSMLMEGHAAIAFDNIDGHLCSPVLEAALTGDVWTDRILATNQTGTFPIRCVWTMTANNPEMNAEFARRCVPIRLSPQTERPCDRTSFKHPNLKEWGRENRSDLIWAALVLVQAWIAAKRPKGSQTLGSYSSWCEVMGGILDVAGIFGFLENLDDMRDDTESTSSAWRKFVAAWNRKYGTKVVGVFDLLSIAESIDGLPLGDKVNPRARATALGIGIRKNRGRVYGGWKIKYVRSSHNAKQWRLQEVVEGEPSEPDHYSRENDEQKLDDIYAEQYE